jgi:hypothetical protein
MLQPLLESKLNTTPSLSIISTSVRFQCCLEFVFVSRTRCMGQHGLSAESGTKRSLLPLCARTLRHPAAVPKT